MDKPRWVATWFLAITAANISHNDSFWWAVAKIFPLSLAACFLELFRSRSQNKKG
jgi:hypothetical protein